MHSLKLVREIHRLLQEGNLSQRKMSQQLRVSRGTISAIARGRRGLHGRESDNAATLASPPARCPDCGYRVYLPCVICRIRQHEDRQRLLRILAAEKPRELVNAPGKKCASSGMTTAQWCRSLQKKSPGLRRHYFRAS